MSDGGGPARRRVRARCADVEGLHHGISVALRYLQAWLAGSGAVTVDSLMEDAATVEIIRSQVWQQLHASAWLDDGSIVDADLVAAATRHEADRLAASGQATPLLEDAVALFLEVATAEPFLPFFTSVAYARHIAHPTPAQHVPALAIPAPVP